MSKCRDWGGGQTRWAPLHQDKKQKWGVSLSVGKRGGAFMGGKTPPYENLISGINKYGWSGGLVGCFANLDDSSSILKR